MAVSRPRYNQKKKRKKGPGRHFKQGYYQPINETKYRQPVDTTMNSSLLPEYRSSWELFYMKLLDHSDKVKYWGCEVVNIKYYDSLQGKVRRYFPDFFVELEDGRRFIQEVKPKSQCQMQNNLDKWAAAQKYCSSLNITFQIITEVELKTMGMKI